jgi:hypothetical protein
MRLSEKPIDEIEVGLQVVSAKGTIGSVKKIIKESDNFKKPIPEIVRFDTIYIEWANSRSSTIFHCNADSITIFGVK